MARIHRRTTQKDLNDSDNYHGVITHLEPDILKFKVKWDLGSRTINKASRDNGIPFELFKILKDNAVKVLHSTFQQIRKTQQQPQDWKRSVFLPIPRKGNAKECSNYHTIALISHGKIPWRRKWQSTPVFLPGESHGWRSLGYSPWDHKELDMTE